MGFPGGLGSYGSKLGLIGLGSSPEVGDLIEMSPGLISHWSLDDPAGTNAADRKGGNTGTFHVAPTNLGVSTPGADGAVTLASGNYITTSATINTATGAVELWFKITANPSGNGLLAGFYDSSTKTDKVLFVDSSGKLNWRVNDGSVKTVTTSAAVQLNRWHYAVGEADGTTATLFLDGASVGSTAAGNTLATYTSSNFYIGGGTADTYVGMPGSYDEVAVFSQAPTAAQILARYNQGILNISNTAARITELAVEVLNVGSPKARITELVVEVPHSVATRKARISELAIEVLRSTGAGLAKTGSGGFTFTGTATASTDHVATASGGFTLGGNASDNNTHVFNVGAVGGFTLGGSGRPYRNLDVAGAGEIGLSGHGHPWRTYNVSASGGFTAGSTGAIYREVSDSAAGGLTLGGHGYVEFVPAPGVVYGFASGGFKLGGRAIGAHPKDVQGRPQTVRFTGTARAYVTPIHVSAAGGFTLAGFAAEADNGPRPVAASGGLKFSGKATAIRDIVARGSGGIILAGATATARDWHVSATGAIGLSGASKPNHFVHVSATSVLSFSGHADVVMTATLAAGGFTFTDLAVARVIIPWRNAALTRPPGGGLPHS